MNKSVEVLPGTLDLMILRTVDLRPMHGVGIAERIRQVTSGVFIVKAGSLFPALHRLEGKGWLASHWGETEEGRRAKFYTLTRSGKSQLAAEKRNFQRVFLAMTQVLEGE
ncbi:MAG TPA: PadR family transcriptional regulator [Bryobacteraceae bacterium]|nr:PadR family transcriptional regulator [Bryobacteraceae bacterium]